MKHREARGTPTKPTPTPMPPVRLPYAELCTYVEALAGRDLTDKERDALIALANEQHRRYCWQCEEKARELFVTMKGG